MQKARRRVWPCAITALMACHIFRSNNLDKCWPLHVRPKVSWADCLHPSTTSKKTIIAPRLLLNSIPLHTQTKRVEPQGLNGRNGVSEMAALRPGFNC